MNMTFDIRVDTASLRQSRIGSITGVLFLDFGEAQFPERRWSDFVVVVLTWWLETLQSISRADQEPTYLQFMDGPYRVRVSPSGTDGLLMECIEERPSELVVHSSTEDFEKTMREIRGAAEQVLKACIQREWRSNELDRLRELLQT
jgi:hypothetical protein